MIILTIANNKGGTGKTTTSVSLADALSRLHSKRVLLVDLDPQGQAATALGLAPAPGAYYLLTMVGRAFSSMRMPLLVACAAS